MTDSSSVANAQKQPKRVLYVCAMSDRTALFSHLVWLGFFVLEAVLWLVCIFLAYGVPATARSAKIKRFFLRLCAVVVGVMLSNTHDVLIHSILR